MANLEETEKQDINRTLDIDNTDGGGNGERKGP